MNYIHHNPRESIFFQVLFPPVIGTLEWIFEKELEKYHEFINDVSNLSLLL